MFFRSWLEGIIIGRVGVLIEKVGSWVPTEARIQLSDSAKYIHVIVDSQLYSVKKDLFLEMLSGNRLGLRLFKWVLH
jgi:hypothetical protein